MTIDTEAQAIADLALATSDVQHIGQTPYHVVPDGYRIESLEALRDRPTRHRGKTNLMDANSFIEFVNQQDTGTDTRIYATVEPPRFVAVFNDHARNDPGWRDFVATYACPLSVEWRAWTSSNGKQMSQEQFAKFIEDNLPDVVSPPAAEMLEIARSLEAKKKVNFASGVRLSNGENELVYEETIQGTAAKGKLSVPETFAIGIPVFEGGQGYHVDARLRYRIEEGGKLSMWFDLMRPHKIIEDAVREVWQTIEAGTNKNILRGSAE